MARFADKSRAKIRATLCPFVPGESAEQRHDRRYDTAHRTESKLREWTDRCGLTLEITNGGQHWIIKHPTDDKHHFGQWWPRSAKLVIRCGWRDGIHAHDVKQVIHELSRAMQKINNGERIRG